MTQRVPLSKAEMEVARVVWKRGGATVREVFDDLPAERNLDYKTVQTYLRRLEAKGYVRPVRQGRSVHYRPRANPQRVIRDTIEDFVARLFDGDPLPLVEHLVRDRNLTPEELKRLRTLVDQLEAQSDVDT